MFVSLLTYAIGLPVDHATIITDLAAFAAYALMIFVPRSPFAGLEFADYFRLGFVGFLALAVAVILGMALLTNY